MNCPRCQSRLSEDAAFCAQCGLSTADINAETLRNDPHDTAQIHDPLLGAVLDSKYQILERLGEGGMGAVYRARRLHIGDEVAVKVLSRKLILNNEIVERFRREARSAAMIRHANVVTIHDFGEAKSSDAPAFIVMELVKGNSLRKILTRDGRLTLERAASLLRDICAGVGVAHRQGVIHRDLKPDNVIVVPPTVDGERESAKVVDFGLARLQETHSDLTLTRTGAMLGSPLYMSPEQCRGDTLDERADVYSLGAMLYEMLVGQPPFPANNVAELIAQHLTARPPSLPESIGAPAAINELCQRALSKNPADRPRDATDFGRQLQFALAGPTIGVATLEVQETPVSVRAKTEPEPVGRKTNRTALMVGLVVMLLIGAVVVVAGIVIIGKLIKRDGSIIGANVTNPSPKSSAQETSDDQRLASSNNQNNTVSESAAQSNLQPGELNLVGEWEGTYGPVNSPATLVIKDARNRTFSGILTQGAVQVAFDGSYELPSRRVTMRETRVLVGSGWSLGENSGELSADGRKMSGNGKDSVGGPYGISYEWSFEKQLARKQ